MPKPLFGVNGSGMHFNLSLFQGDKNAFWDEGADLQLSKTAKHFMAGVLKHVQGFTAVTNPIVNSYKRLVWAMKHHVMWHGQHKTVHH